MKLRTIFATSVAVLGMGLTPVIAPTIGLSSIAQASVGSSFIVGEKGVVTVNGNIAGAHVYDINAKINSDFTSKGLPSGSTWYTNSGYDYNGHSYYKVATNQYVRDDEVTLSYQ